MGDEFRKYVAALWIYVILYSHWRQRVEVVRIVGGLRMAYLRTPMSSGGMRFGAQ